MQGHYNILKIVFNLFVSYPAFCGHFQLFGHRDLQTIFPRVVLECNNLEKYFMLFFQI